VLCGCATSTPTPPKPHAAAPKVFVSATLDPGYTLTPQSRISVFIDEKASIEDRRLGALLLSQLRTNSFNVVSAEADFVIVCSMEHPTVTSGGETFAFQRLWVVAYSRADLQAGKTKTVWEGCVSVGPYDRQFDRDPVSAIRTLLQYFGKDFKGDTPLIEQK